ncbi:MAG: ATP-dependent sacrificial sulfur transferase LarE [Bacteroidales bacterium]|nr:ATP-dependent sacrificial sulfur transferase LarE [Bacteroidales bacterium]
MKLSRVISDKIGNIEKILGEMKSVAVAFSGGVDSSLLLKLAHDMLRNNAVGIYIDSPLQPKRERLLFEETIKLIGCDIIKKPVDILDHKAFKENPTDRCYFCKHFIFDVIMQIAQNEGYSYVADGSNHDDLKDYRPGAKALKEKGVRSPLREAGFTKKEIRELSKFYGLPTWDKEALACLATRISYGKEISKRKLQMIDMAEEELVNRGFINVRARHYDDTVKIEVDKKQIDKLSDNKNRSEILTIMKKIGFRYIIIDPEGYRTGSLNES